MKLKTGIFLVPICLVLTSGVYRHDTPIEKYLQLANQDKFRIVGQVLKLKDGSWIAGGSFVLIDSVTILSAGHCFMNDIKKDTVINYHGQKLKTYIVKGKQKANDSDFRFSVMNVHRSARTILLHPDYLIDGTCDIAIIKLTEPIDGVRRLAINRQLNEINDTVIGVGFGVSGPANKPELVNAYQIKLAGQNIIDSIDGKKINGEGSVLFADFDSPEPRQGCNKTGSDTPLELEYSGGGGDSGGPLFRYGQKELLLVGILSGAPRTINNLNKNGYYCQLNEWTRVSVFKDWINDNR